MDSAHLTTIVLLCFIGFMVFINKEHHAAEAKIQKKKFRKSDK
jgi:hypothetical protein